MTQSPMVPDPARHLENEFIPPLEARHAWGPSWDRHLQVHSAWQDAGGNTDGQACQWVEPEVGKRTNQDGRRWSANRYPFGRTRNVGNGRNTARNSPSFIERRHRSVAIGFPDRRMTG